MSKMPRIKHDDLNRYGIQMSENIATIALCMFKHLNEDNDLNKIVADSYFDVFTHSNRHMKSLLGDNEWYGFGLVLRGNSLSIVIKASSDSSVK